MSTPQDPAKASSVLPRTSRRPYKKSRQGCNTCKTRRVKCDEVHPLCGPCARRFVDIKTCDYGPPVEKTVPERVIRALQPRPAGHVQPALSPRPAGTDLSAPTHLLELRLMHHYSRVTCNLPARSQKSVLPVSPYPMWEIDMPQLSFSSDLVLNALLAVSSLHHLAVTPNDGVLAHASRFYLDKAVKKYRAAIADTKNRNVEILMTTATLLVHHTWLTSHFNDTKEPFTMAKHLVTFRMCEGLNTLAKELSPGPEKPDSISEISPLPTRDQVVECKYQGFKDAAMEDLALFSQHFKHGSVSIEDQDVYEKVAEDLATTYSLIASGTRDVSFVEQEIAVAIHRLPPRFITLLERHDPITMALLARSISLLKVFDDNTAWWIHGTGECEVARGAVRGMYHLMPTKWRWTMDWPQKLVSGEVKLDFVQK